jgi:hypothetical protein
MLGFLSTVIVLLHYIVLDSVTLLRSFHIHTESLFLR